MTVLIERATKAIDLLPCPFCGGTPELMDTLPSGSYWYRCEECCGETEGGKTHAEAITAWNRRAPSPSPAPGGVTLPADEANAICKRLEYDASWDKCGHGYYRMKRALAFLAQSGEKKRDAIDKWIDGGVNADYAAAHTTPPSWPDPLESPQAEATRNGKLDDTEIRNLFDCMERELRLHRERAANPAQVTDARYDSVALEAARDIIKLTRRGEFDDQLKAKIQVRIIDALTASRAECEGLRAALEEIANPLDTMRRRAAETGRRLDGAIANTLANDANHLKQIARAALSQKETGDVE